MKNADYYKELSKKEALKDKSVKDFSDNLDGELTRINNLRFNTSVVSKLLHPFRTIRTYYDYRRLTALKDEFDCYMDSDVLLYDNCYSGDTIEDLEGSARYYKPQAIKNYVKTKEIELKKN